MKIPEYTTMEEYVIVRTVGKEDILPVGSFVKPIELVYLPQHIKDSSSYRWMKIAEQIFCYTHFGIILLPTNLIRRIDG